MPKTRLTIYELICKAPEHELWPRFTCLYSATARQRQGEREAPAQPHSRANFAATALWVLRVLTDDVLLLSPFG